MADMDSSITSWINSFSGHSIFVDWFMIVLTYAGPVVMVGLIAARWFSKVDRAGERHLAIQCGAATMLGLILNQLLLLAIHRVRPYDVGLTHLIIGRSQDPSFPSDHATVAFAITSLLVFARDKWLVLSFLFAVLIGASRVFVGTHYLSDVLGGALTGAAGAMIMRMNYHRLDSLTARLVKIF
jgi:undecaprenyl-diphosphatase